MAKFKVGDKVRVSEKVKLEGIPHDGWKVLHVLTDDRYAVVHDKPEGWSRKPILDVFEHELAFNSAPIASMNAVVQNAINVCNRTAQNADNFASDKLRNEWNSAFRSLKRLHDMAAAEKHQSVMDAANAAAKTLMDRTKW